MNILFIDTETTGLDASKHSIIEIACAHYKDGKLQSTFQRKFISNSPILDMGALRVNKQNTASLLEIGKACSEQKGAFDLMDYLLSLDNKDLHVCGHNVHFDVGFVKALLTRYGIEGWDQAVSYRQLDTCDRARMLIESGIITEQMGGRGAGLKIIATALGVTVDESKLHGAMYDTELCAAVYFKMIEILRNRRG